MGVIRLKNPVSMEIPTLKDVFTKAFGQNAAVPVDIDASMDDFRYMIESDRFGVFLRLDGFDAQGLCVMALPESKIFPYPTCLTFYSEGPKAVTDELIKAGVDFVKANGYTKFWGVNATGKPNAAWMKVFKQAGKERIIGSLVEFEPT